MVLDIQDIVRVRAEIAPRTAAQPQFGRTLLVVRDESFDPDNYRRTQVFANIREVAEEHGSETEAYRAAQVYFSQSPFPRPLVIGRWRGTPEAAVLTGGALGGSALSDIQAFGTATMTVQGVGVTVTGLGSLADLEALATEVQTELRATGVASLADATVTYDGAVFIITLGFDAAGDPYQFAAHPTDVSQTLAATMGLTGGSGTVQEGRGEDIGSGLERIATVDDGWYFVTVDSRIADTDEAVSLARWIEASDRHMLALDTTETVTLAPDETRSTAAKLHALGLERTFVVWSETSDHKALSMAARLGTVRFDGQNTLITPKFRSLPTTAPDTLSTAQKRELDRKRVNYYTRFGADAIFAEGWLLSGEWIDVRYWLDWITNAVQTEVFNLLRNHPTRVSQTAAGVGSIESVIEGVCELGRRNGGIAPGRAPFTSQT